MPSNPKQWHRKVFPTAHRLILERLLRASLSKIHGNVLVVGAGFDPYKRWLRRASRVCLTDISPELDGLDCVADAHDLPFAEASFDAVIAVEVFEHLQRPAVAASEIHRVLKPGGTALISVPFLFRVHGDPFDFNRFTKSGLETLFSEFTAVKPVEFGTRIHVISDIVTTASPALASLRVMNHILALSLFSGRGSRDCPSGYCVELVR